MEYASGRMPRPPGGPWQCVPSFRPRCRCSGFLTQGTKGARAMNTTVVTALALIFAVATTSAQEVLPTPEQPFKGHIGRTVSDSTSDFPRAIEAPAGAPNILLILTDDVGYGASSTFGGPIATPTIDS